MLARYSSIHEKTILDRSFGRRMACLEEHLPYLENDGCPQVHSLPEIHDAIFCIVKSGCSWRLLPHELLPWKTVYHYFRLWRIDGTWERECTKPCVSGCGSA
jgi:transposase